MQSLEERHKKCLEKVDLSFEFYFSISYDLTKPISKNITKHLRNNENKFRKSMGDKTSRDSIKSNEEIVLHTAYLENYYDFFAWNHNLINDFMDSIANRRWILPIIHGYIEQKSIIPILFTN